MLKSNAKPSAPRVHRKKYAAVDFDEFKVEHPEEENKVDVDELMDGTSVREIIRAERKSKRNRGAADPNLQ